MERVGITSYSFPEVQAGALPDAPILLVFVSASGYNKQNFGLIQEV